MIGLRLISLVDHQLNWYEFIGRVLGKALYEGILVDIGFAPFFCKLAGTSRARQQLTDMYQWRSGWAVNRTSMTSTRWIKSSTKA
jgi:hypothetical protein